MRNKSVFLLLALTMLLIANPAPAEIRYNVTDLGTLEGFPFVCVQAINDNGQIVGWVTKGEYPEVSKAVLFDSTGKGNNIDLGTLGGLRNYALAINNNGQIVGAADSNNFNPSWNPWHPTIFDTSGQANNVILGNNGRAWSINDYGQVVGDTLNASGFGRATIFDVSDPNNNILLGTIDGFDNSVARSINNIGQIVGHADNFPLPGYRAMLFDYTGGGNDIDLGTLGGQYSAAISINYKGQIVGIASIASGYEHAAIFNPNDPGSNIDLGSLPGCNYSIATSINNQGQIVGYASIEEMVEPSYAVMFDPTEDGNNINLNDLIDPDIDWKLNSAICINDNGWIVGNGINPDGNRRAFLLTPVPETKSFLLLALGVVFLRKAVH
jgi:probable HAF family extracellular repeat protein